MLKQKSDKDRFISDVQFMIAEIGDCILQRSLELLQDDITVPLPLNVCNPETKPWKEIELFIVERLNCLNYKEKNASSFKIPTRLLGKEYTSIGFPY